jgi:hypothetical protein
MVECHEPERPIFRRQFFSIGHRRWRIPHQSEIGSLALESIRLNAEEFAPTKNAVACADEPEDGAPAK